MSTPFVWAAKTDVGAVRGHNEDCHVVDPNLGLFVVCDGMGGHARGAVASSTACRTIRDGVASEPPSPRLRVARDVLVEAIHTANRRVLLLGSGDRRPGTTVAALLWAGGGFVIAHVGDSRVLRLRGGKLLQLTRDHSLANQLIDQHRLSPEEAASFPYRHVITRGLGLRQDVAIDVQASRLCYGDVFLVASDGLEVLGPEVVQGCLELRPTAAVNRLIARSLAAGAPDNVTVIVVRVERRLA
jgi:serine/threonine protein phosphatase PrpC